MSLKPINFKRNVKKSFKKTKQKNPKKKPSSRIGKIWYFIWEDDSLLSWIINIILAFVFIKYILYPGLGWLFGTVNPVVAVVSGSMEHKTAAQCVKTLGGYPQGICLKRSNTYMLCDKSYQEKQKVDFDFFWSDCGYFYGKYNITKQDFKKFRFKNGFNTGDIIVLFGASPEKISKGDVIVFRARKGDSSEPIIHRVVKKWQENGKYYFQTKGDHNSGSIDTPYLNEIKISETQIIGKAVFRIPWLGYVKIGFVSLLYFFKLNLLLKLFV